MNNYEHEIDIIDMLKECLKRWWIILAMAILGAIVGGVITVYTSSSQAVGKTVIEEELSDKEKSICVVWIEAKEKLDSVSVSDIESNEELNYYYTLKITLVNDFDKLSDIQKEYIRFISTNDDVSTNDDISINDDVRLIEILKMVILGFGAGAIISAMTICAVYIMSGTIKTQDDILVYGMNDYYNKDKDYMKSLVEKMCRNNAISNLGIVGEEALAKQIDCECLSGNAIKICYLGNPLISSEAIRNINDMDGVMYVVKLKLTKNNEAYKTIRIINELGVKMVGCIVVP